MAGEELNMDDAVSSIASDIGLGQSEETSTEEKEVVETDTTTETEVAETTQAATKEKTAAAATQTQTGETTARKAPKAWAQDKHELWSKMDPAAQEYIETRERQMLDGLTQYGDAAKFGKELRDVINPHMELIKAQNIPPAKAVEYLFNAHRQLSVGSPEQKLAYFAQIAKTYGIDLGKAATVAGEQAQEPAAVRELRSRTERLERERQSEREAAAQEMSTKVAKQVNDFAEAKDEKGNPKNPYFDDCAEHIVKLIQGGYPLEDAYQIAIYANPVTKEKELARLQTEKDASLRAKAKQEAEKARNAGRTNVNSRDTNREATPAKAKRWEDTLDETYKAIQERQTH